MPISDSNGYPPMTMNKSTLIDISATLPDYISRGKKYPIFDCCTIRLCDFFLNL